MRAEQARALLNDGRARLLLGQIEQALARAEATGLEVTRAEIECNLGNLDCSKALRPRKSCNRDS
jgi:hypothetical protein